MEEWERRFTNQGGNRGKGTGRVFHRQALFGTFRGRKYYPFMHGTDMLDAVATVQQFDSSTTGD